jgi:hypothetical protein
LQVAPLLVALDSFVLVLFTSLFFLGELLLFPSQVSGGHSFSHKSLHAIFSFLNDLTLFLHHSYDALNEGHRVANDLLVQLKVFGHFLHIFSQVRVLNAIFCDLNSEHLLVLLQFSHLLAGKFPSLLEFGLQIGQFIFHFPFNVLLRLNLCKQATLLLLNGLDLNC